MSYGPSSVDVMTTPSPVHPAVSLVTLGVADLPVSTAFYQRLGFPLSSASVPGVVSFFRTAGGLLGLYGAADLAADAQLPPREGSGFTGVTLAINVGSHAHVDASIAGAEAAGAKVIKAPQVTDWGGYHGYFTDPDGHAWEIAHNPGWPLDATGLPQLPA